MEQVTAHHAYAGDGGFKRPHLPNTGRDIWWFPHKSQKWIYKNKLLQIVAVIASIKCFMIVSVA
jgi:hypothetical protein